jgi:predicted RNA-binding Zn-ribbon protein involved in translation (DUF1610 family)
MNDLKPTPTTTVCPECGEDGLTLCVDVTQYRDLYCTNGEWRASPVRHHEILDMPMSVRVLCPSCGTHFHVPETIAGF